MSTVEAWNVSRLEVSVVGMDNTVLDGFISQGVDRVVLHAVQSPFAMYKHTLIKAVAPAMQTMGRDFLNTHLLALLLKIMASHTNVRRKIGRHWKRRWIFVTCY